MKSPLLLATALVLLAGPALATPTELAQRTVEAISAGVAKTEAAVKRGGAAVSEGIQRGVRAVNEGADKAAHRVGLPAGTAADARRAQDTPQRKADAHPDATTEPVAQGPAKDKASR